MLFLCTHNSARSIMAEAIFNHLAPEDWHAMSAGSHPAGQVHPRALALLARQGIPAERLHSKSWDHLPVPPDIVITVCASAAGETCPAYLGPVLRSHWGLDDPARATGTEDEINAEFGKAYRTLRSRIEAFLMLSMSDWERERGRLKAELDRIGSLLP
jgi:arsenate reductase